MKKPMVRLGITVGVIACGVVGGAAGCFGSSTPTPGTSGTNNGATGSSGASGSASGTGTSGTGTSGTVTPTDGGPTVPPAANAVVLDDMTMAQSVLGGSWYTYSDRTLPNSEPPITQGAPPGMIVPAEGAMFAANTDAKGPTFVAGDAGGPTLWPYREAKGGGEMTWGAGFGLDIVSSVPDGGPVAFNTCPNDAGRPIFVTSGPDTSNVGVPVAFDAIAAGYTGISFYGTSFGATPQSVAIQMDDNHTSPWGGECAVCQNGGKCTAEADGGKVCPCSDSFIETELFPAGTWKLFTIKFTDIAFSTANWSTQGLPKGGINAHSLYNLHFQLTTSPPKALAAFDVGVAYITWTR